MKLTKKIKDTILNGYKNLDNPASFTSSNKIRISLGLEKIPIKLFEQVLNTNLAYVSHKRAVRKFKRRKTIAPGVGIM